MDELARHVGILNSNFSKNFLGVYKTASVSKRRRLVPHIYTIYRRWYYSTLVEGTPLSPANMFSGMRDYFNVYANTHVLPIVRTPTKLVGILAKTVEYNPDAHPIIKDISRVVEYANPCIDIHEMDALTEEQAFNISLLLSIKDPYYAAFLFDLSVRLGFIEKVPSLYVNRLKPTAKFDEFMKQKPRDVLKQLVDATIRFCSYGLSTVLQMPRSTFSEEFILKILKNPMKTDEIIQYAFESIGVDMTQVVNREIFDKEFKDSQELEDAEGLIHSMYVVGLALDRFLHTPFGFFFRLINPLYTATFDFEEEMLSFLEISKDHRETFFSFYLPPEVYALTELGMDILGVQPEPEQSLPMIQFAQMKDSAFLDENTFEQFIEMAGHFFPQLFEIILRGQIYSLKIKAAYKPSFWAHVQVSEHTSLHELYTFIAELFDLKENSDYSFFHDKTENLFAEYPSAKRLGRLRVQRDDADTKLSSLDFNHMKHMVLTAYNQALPFTNELPTKRLAIEFLGETEPYFDEDYPRVARLSKALSDLLK